MKRDVEAKPMREGDKNACNELPRVKGKDIKAHQINPRHIAEYDDMMSAGSLALLTKRKNSLEFFLILTDSTVQGA